MPVSRDRFRDVILRHLTQPTRGLERKKDLSLFIPDSFYFLCTAAVICQCAKEPISPELLGPLRTHPLGKELFPCGKEKDWAISLMCEQWTTCFSHNVLESSGQGKKLLLLSFSFNFSLSRGFKWTCIPQKNRLSLGIILWLVMTLIQIAAAMFPLIKSRYPRLEYHDGSLFHCHRQTFRRKIFSLLLLSRTTCYGPLYLWWRCLCPRAVLRSMALFLCRVGRKTRKVFFSRSSQSAIDVL